MTLRDWNQTKFFCEFNQRIEVLIKENTSEIEMASDEPKLPFVS